ncbi:MAG: glucan biosynthesis protein [Opitutaceae bacterium]|jgi:glucans biosynthesis protein|nr:glucan biosynthesis protein [Opitutaceae bacterium]
MHHTLQQLPTLAAFAAVLFCTSAMPGAAQPASPAPLGAPFSFERLQARARDLAATPYQARASRVPPVLQNLDYDRHRDIRFDPAQSLWRAENLPFQLQFFHPGFIQRHTVQIHEVVDGHERPVPFAQKLFDYGKNTGLDGAIPSDMGFSGLRVTTPLNTPGHFDELIVFQGASYFRALSRGARYGLSARGLALNTAEPGGEEFPVFEEFWVERPRPGAREIVIHALLDSPGVAGAYQFSIAPGDDTVARVRATLFLRAGAENTVRVLGVAPLTSMFWFGENSTRRFEDLRPEVHDSDGLAMHTGAGEWIWRPLDNPRAVRAAAFTDQNPRGFGLAQRDRAFSSYEDIEAAYHLRPSAWVEPVGDWGRGEVRLVEIPTPDETNDNIVAFWVPGQLPPAGRPLTLEYRLHWHTGAARLAQPPGGRVIATRQGHSKTHEPELRRFWVDFENVSPSMPPLGDRSTGATPPADDRSAGIPAREIADKHVHAPVSATAAAATAATPSATVGPDLASGRARQTRLDTRSPPAPATATSTTATGATTTTTTTTTTAATTATAAATTTAIEAVVTVGDGAKLVHAGVEQNPFNRTWRAAFAIKPDGSGNPVELRCFLRDATGALTETWSYLWNQ